MTVTLQDRFPVLERWSSSADYHTLHHAQGKLLLGPACCTAENLHRPLCTQATGGCLHVLQFCLHWCCQTMCLSQAGTCWQHVLFHRSADSVCLLQTSCQSLCRVDFRFLRAGQLLHRTTSCTMHKVHCGRVLLVALLRISPSSVCLLHVPPLLLGYLLCMCLPSPKRNSALWHHVLPHRSDDCVLLLQTTCQSFCRVDFQFLSQLPH